MNTPLTRAEFEQELAKRHPGKTIYSKLWRNYPNSIFYYDTKDFDGTTNNIGIYSSYQIYSLDPA